MADRPDAFTARALIYLGGIADDLDRGDEALDFVRRSIEASLPFGVDLQVGATIGMGCVLAERADAAAAGYAVEAIELCRRAGSPEQLTATLPTAAMVCWQVGDLAASRRFVAEAMPLLADSRRIARVVLLSVAAGNALAEGDLAAAIELGTIADTDATDLGIERELPLIRCLLARALLATGNLAGAGAKALAGFQAATSLTFRSPLALCLETAALICLARDRPDSVATAGVLLDGAAVVRERGQRPGPVTLSAAVTRARAAITADRGAGWRRGGQRGAGGAGGPGGQHADLAAVVELAVAALGAGPAADVSDIARTRTR